MPDNISYKNNTCCSSIWELLVTFLFCFRKIYEYHILSYVMTLVILITYYRNKRIGILPPTRYVIILLFVWTKQIHTCIRAAECTCVRLEMRNGEIGQNCKFSIYVIALLLGSFTPTIAVNYYLRCSPIWKYFNINPLGIEISSMVLGHTLSVIYVYIYIISIYFHSIATEPYTN